MIRKWTKDGFRNPKYDIWDMRLGITMLALTFVGAVVMMAIG